MEIKHDVIVNETSVASTVKLCWLPRTSCFYSTYVTVRKGLRVFLITISLFNNISLHFFFCTLSPPPNFVLGGSKEQKKFVIFWSSIPGYTCIFIATVSFCELHACASLTRKILAPEDFYCPYNLNGRFVWLSALICFCFQQSEFNFIKGKKCPTKHKAV